MYLSKPQVPNSNSQASTVELFEVPINLQATLRLAADVFDTVITMSLLCRRPGLLGSRTGDSSVLLAAVPHIVGVHPLPQGTHLQPPACAYDKHACSQLTEPKWHRRSPPTVCVGMREW